MTSLDLVTAIVCIAMVILLIVLLGWMFIDMCCPNLFRGIKIKFTVKGCIDFIKAIYNMETR